MKNNLSLLLTFRWHIKECHIVLSQHYDSKKIFQQNASFSHSLLKNDNKILPNILVVQGQDFCQGSRDVLIRNNLTKYWTGLIGCTDQNTVM